jgi:hypothetical protein
MSIKSSALTLAGQFRGDLTIELRDRMAAAGEGSAVERIVRWVA